MKGLLNTKLLPFVDSALPVGSFAFSQGLESASALGIVNNPDSLFQYIKNFMDLLLKSELPFINSIYENIASDKQTLEEMHLEYDALLSVPTIHHSSVSQGQSWIRLFEVLTTGETFLNYIEWLRAKSLPIHALFIFSVGMKDRVVELNEARLVFLYNNIREQLNAAIRLSIIGPMQAQALLHDLLQEIENLSQKEIDFNYKQAVRNAPMIDIFQAYHHTLYSKLFQS